MHTWRPFCLQSLWLHLSAISVSTHEDLSVYSHSKHISLLSQYSHIKTFLCTVTMSTFVKSQWDGSSNALFSSYLSFSSSGLFLKSQSYKYIHADQHTGVNELTNTHSLLDIHVHFVQQNLMIYQSLVYKCKYQNMQTSNMPYMVVSMASSCIVNPN